MNDLIITEYDGNMVTALYEDNRVTELNLINTDNETEIGNIYVGRINNLVKSINAAFVKISDDMTCYMSLKDVEKAVFIKKQSAKKISSGDELIVQLVKDEIKTKAAVVSPEFTLTGKNLVLIHGSSGLRISKKITKAEDRKNLEELFGDLCDLKDVSAGVLLRTNAGYADKEEIVSEYKRLVNTYKAIVKKSSHNTAYTCLYRELPSYKRMIRDASSGAINRIFTDEKAIFDDIADFLKDYPSTFYDKSMISFEYVKEKGELAIKYRLERAFDSALKRTVFLKSGANLIIDYTEAMTVIDVNTSKAIDVKNSSEETFLKINEEAAREIAIQLKLRNLSGIIIVDFINMSSEENMEKLLGILKAEVKKDHIQTEVADITRLGLVELTRKKVYRSLPEQIKAKKC